MWIADIPPTKLARSGLSTIEFNKKRPHVRNVELANELYRAFRVVAVRYQNIELIDSSSCLSFKPTLKRCCDCSITFDCS